MRLLLFIASLCVAVTAPHVTAFDIPESGMTAPGLGMQQPSVVTCKIQNETATANGRSEVAYYECIAVNGAIVPAVTFVVFSDGAGELWLRQLVGRTVDVRLEVVQ
jgi:hypothetical protein